MLFNHRLHFHHFCSNRRWKTEILKMRSGHECWLDWISLLYFLCCNLAGMPTFQVCSLALSYHNPAIKKKSMKLLEVTLGLHIQLRRKASIKSLKILKYFARTLFNSVLEKVVSIFLEQKEKQIRVFSKFLPQMCHLRVPCILREPIFSFFNIFLYQVIWNSMILL